MSAAYTPGPWIVHASSHPEFPGLLIEQRHTGGNTGIVVAQCEPIPEMFANAALLAAAPQMLEALRQASAALATLQSPSISRAKLLVFDAIAAATKVSS